MAKFAAPARQTASVLKAVQGTVLRSVGTVRNYEQALTRVAEYVRDTRVCPDLRNLSRDQALAYLEQRGQAVGQKTLDMERQAIQCMFQHVTGRLAIGERLPVVRSAHPQKLVARAYTAEQVRLIAAAQTPRNALATELAYAAGLRAHELLTLRPATERPADPRPALASKWRGRDGEREPATACGRRGCGVVAAIEQGAHAFDDAAAMFGHRQRKAATHAHAVHACDHRQRAGADRPGPLRRARPRRGETRSCWPSWPA